MRNDLAAAAAGGAGRSDGKKSLASGNLACATAVPAGFGLGVCFAPVAVAFGTDLFLFNFNFGFGSKDRFHEIQL
jgi:hypothetical protein